MTYLQLEQDTYTYLSTSTRAWNLQLEPLSPHFSTGERSSTWKTALSIGLSIHVGSLTSREKPSGLICCRSKAEAVRARHMLQ